MKKAVSPLSRARQPANGSLISLTKKLAKNYLDITKRLAKMREGRGSQVREQ
jgi:hypothetical protein